MKGRRSVTPNVRKARARDRPWGDPTRRWLRRQAPILGVVVVVVPACLGGPAAWGWCRTHPYFAVRTVEIEGQARLTRQEVMDQAGVHPGTSVWDVVPATVARRLREHPWIDTASVERWFPGSVRIELQERKPVAIARLGDLYYVDGEGHLLGILREGDSPDFPLITGLEEKHAAPLVAVALRHAAQVLRSCVVTGWTESVSEVHVDRRRGVTVFPLEIAVPVVLGWGPWEEKLVRAARALTDWKGREVELAQVDVSFADLVVVRLRNERVPAAVGRGGKGIQV